MKSQAGAYPTFIEIMALYQGILKPQEVQKLYQQKNFGIAK